MANYGMLQDKTERIWLWSQFWVNASRYWSDLSFLWTPVKKNKTKQNKEIEQLGMVHQFYIQLSKEALGGGGGEVWGPFEQVLTAHISHATLSSIALRLSLSKRCLFFRHFFTLFLLWIFFITHHPIARSRWSRWHDFFLYWAARRLLLSLFPDINVANI